jgi:hypothetical protein
MRYLLILLVCLFISCNSRYEKTQPIVEPEKVIDTIIPITLPNYAIFDHKDKQYTVDSYELVDGWYLLPNKDRTTWIKEELIYKIVKYN